MAILTKLNFKMIWFVRLQKNDEGNVNPTDEQEPSLTRRVMDVMMMKKTNLEKNVEHYKAEGVKLTGMNQQAICSQFRELIKNVYSVCWKYITGSLQIVPACWICDQKRLILGHSTVFCCHRLYSACLSFVLSPIALFASQHNFFYTS